MSRAVFLRLLEPFRNNFQHFLPFNRRTRCSLRRSRRQSGTFPRLHRRHLLFLLHQLKTFQIHPKITDLVLQTKNTLLTEAFARKLSGSMTVRVQGVRGVRNRDQRGPYWTLRKTEKKTGVIWRFAEKLFRLDGFGAWLADECLNFFFSVLFFPMHHRCFRIDRSAFFPLIRIQCLIRMLWKPVTVVSSQSYDRNTKRRRGRGVGRKR